MVQMRSKATEIAGLRRRHPVGLDCTCEGLLAGMGPEGGNPLSPLAKERVLAMLAVENQRITPAQTGSKAEFGAVAQMR